MGHAPPLALGIERDQPGAFFAGVCLQVFKSRQLALADDGGVVRVVVQRWIKIEYGLAVSLDKPVDPLVRHQHIVGRDTGLPGVQGFAPGDAPGGVFERHPSRNDRRGFAAQLQRHRGQVIGGGTHHLLADMGRAGEQQVIEGQSGKPHRHFGVAQHHGDHVFGENPPQQVFEQTAGGGRVLTEFEHHSVARRQGADQRPHGQIQRVVPRHDYTHHAHGLIHHLGAGGLEHHAHVAP